MSAARKHTALAAASILIVLAFGLADFAGAARGGDPRDKQDPSTPQNLRVTSAGPYALGLAWDAASDNVAVAGYYLYVNDHRARVTGTSWTAYGLACGQTVSVSLFAFDTSRNLSAPATASMSTAACPDLQAPSTPTGFAQQGTTQNAVVLAWKPSSDNVGVTGYRVYRNLFTVANVTEPAVTLTGLGCGSVYSYDVDAVDAAGNRSPQGTAWVQTADCGDGQAPTAPTGLALTSHSQSSLAFSWGPSSDNVGVAGYELSLNGSTEATVQDTRASVGSLACGQSYAASVSAYDAAGNSSPAATMNASTDTCTPPPAGDTSPPSKPVLSLGPATQDSLVLNWQASSDNVGVDHYDVFRGSSDQPADQVKVDQTTGLSHTFNGLTCGTDYSLALQAVDAAGNASLLAEAIWYPVRTAACSSPAPAADTTPPSTPQLSLGPATQTTLVLNWQPSTDNVGVDHYDAFQGSSDQASGQVKVGATSGLTYTYKNLACGTDYSLGLQAADAAGNVSPLAGAIWYPVRTAACSSPAPAADTTPPSQPGALSVSSATATVISLTWTASTDNVAVAGYDVYRDGQNVATPTTPGQTVSGLSCGTAYTFEVDAYDAAGNHSSRAQVTASTAACSDSQPPSVPGNLAASARTSSSITLTWSPSTDNVGVTGYGLYKAGAQVGSVSSSTGIFSGLACNTNYTLAVDAVDAAGNRSQKASVLVATTACPDTTPPSTPTGLAASSVTQTDLSLSWTASSDNVGVTGYDVYRNGTKMTTPSGTQVQQNGLACATSYTFGVVARDAAGNSSPQAQLPVTTAACSAPPPPPPPSGSALSVSPNGNDSTCVRGDTSKPCASFDRAYQLAQCGDVVQIQSGTYPDQIIRETAAGSACSNRITFQGDGSPVVHWIQLGTCGNCNGGATDAADNLVFRGFKLTWGFVGNGDANNITLDQIDGGSYLFGGSANNIRVQDSDWGPCGSQGQSGDCRTWITGDPRSGQPRLFQGVQNFVSYHNVYHDMQIEASGDHWECFWIGGGTNVTFDGDKFYNCTTNAIALPDTEMLGTWRFQNNWFGFARTTALKFGLGGGCPTGTIYILNNSFAPGQTTGDEEGGQACGRIIVRGNILSTSYYFQSATCIAGAVYSNNVFLNGITVSGIDGTRTLNSSPCGTNAVQTSSVPYMNASDRSGMNYHLSGASVADNVVPSGGATDVAQDFDDQNRPYPADAGSDER